MLTEKHLLELRGSGLTDATIEAAGIRSVNGELKQILGWVPKGMSWGDAWLIPFRDAAGRDTGYCRAKLDFPRADANGKPVKYESPRGQPNRVYFPPGVGDALATADTIILTEGEKKCLKGWQEGFVCLGLVGVWGWQEKRKRTDTGRAYGKRQLVPDLAAIEWRGKTVFIVFDSDAAQKPSVQLAESRLAECLADLGADVRVVRFPPAADGAKVGLDDYLLTHTPDDLRRLMGDAREVETPEPPTLMDWARMFLEDQFTTQEGITLRWWRDEFHVWDGRRYRTVPEAELRGVLLQWLDERTAANPRLAADVLVCLASEVRVPFDVEQPALLTDGGATRPEWIVLQNGCFDLGAFLKDGSEKLVPHTPRMFTPTALPFAFHADVSCPTWLKTLHDIFDGDTECFSLLAEWFGYCLTEDTRHHAIMMLEGPPRTGKGTVLRTLKMIVGDDNTVTPRFSTMGETFGLMGLLGKRAAICPDAHLGRGDKAIGLLELLKLLSGEDSVEVQRKHLPPLPNVRFRVRFTLAVNQLPKFGDNAGALASRLLILPFRNSFLGKEDRDLESKLTAEAEGILGWSLWGLRRLQQQGGFTRPKVSEPILRDFERLCSPVKAFLEDECTVAPGERVLKSDLWEAWRKWCTDNGHESGSRERFGSALHSIAGVRRAQPRIESGGRREEYLGVGLGKAAEGDSGTG